MQLKFKFVFFLTLLCLFSNAFLKNMKSKYVSKNLVESSTGNKNSEKYNMKANSKSQKTFDVNDDQIFYNEGFAYNYAQGLSLFRDMSRKLFEGDRGHIDHCIDIASATSLNQYYLFRKLWDSMAEINNEYKLQKYYKQSSESGDATNRASFLKKINSFTKLNQWSNIVISEYQFIFNNVEANSNLKKECIKIFSRPISSMNDFLTILNDRRFFGGQFYRMKNEGFIDSMYSVHRENLSDDSFKKLNDVSNQLLLFNSDSFNSVLNNSPMTKKKISAYSDDFFELPEAPVFIIKLKYMSLLHNY